MPQTIADIMVIYHDVPYFFLLTLNVRPLLYVSVRHIGFIF